MTLVGNKISVGESSHTLRCCWESEQSVWSYFNQNSRPYIVSKLPRDPHAMLVFHYSRLTPTHCLLFIGHGLHLRIAFFLLVTAYSHAMLVLHWSQLTPTHCLFSGNHFVDFIYGRVYLSTTFAEFIASQVDISNNFLDFAHNTLTLTFLMVKSTGSTNLKEKMNTFYATLRHLTHRQEKLNKKLEKLKVIWTWILEAISHSDYLCTVVFTFHSI